MELDELFIKRLIFIKYLFGNACEYSKQEEPNCNVAILGFQDAVELFLDLAIEYKDLSRNVYLNKY